MLEIDNEWREFAKWCFAARGSRLEGISAKIIARRFDGAWFLSRRDSTIVARYEVPGIMRKIAPSQRDETKIGFQM
jgi:hypothetical protein